MGSHPKINIKKHIKFKHYHRRHKLHSGFMVISFTIALVSLILLSTLVIYATADSQQILLSLDITDPNAAVPISEGDSGGGGGSSTPSPILTKPPKAVSSTPRAFEVFLLGEDGKKHPDGLATNARAQTKIPVLRTNRPVFHGQIDLPFAVILLEVHSDPEEAITSTLQASETGFWEFSFSEALSEEPHVLFVTIFDAQAEVELGKTVLHFQIDTSRPEQQPPAPSLEIQKPTAPQESLYEQGQLTYDVKVTIPASYEVINPGQDLLVKLDVVNLAASQTPQDIVVVYTVRDERHAIVLEETEKVLVGQTESLVRLFRTGYKLPPGNYTLEVAVPYPDERNIIAVSYIDFEVKGQPVIALSKNATVNLNLVFQALGVLLTVFTLITYYEYKQVESLARLIHQITEKDFFVKGLIHKF